MIYSVDFMSMTEKLNPLAVCRYLDETGWSLFPYKRENVKIYQLAEGDMFEQIMVPMDKGFRDYRQIMYDAVQTIARIEKRPVEQVMLYLLNPSTDILKIRLDRDNIESGNILLDDAINLYENAKKLLAATALDIVNPKKIHYGRIDESVQKFLSQCKFGQTEIGSYVVSVVCPFAELSEAEGYRQLSIFSEEEQCANSLTRQVTNRLMSNIALVKRHIDEGNLESLAEEEEISSNFYEALNGLNSQSENTEVEFTAIWSPVVKKNRCSYDQIKISNDYYQPISTVINRIKKYTNARTEIVGKIRQLSAVPAVDKRKTGVVTVVYVGDNNRVKSVTATLEREDYENAVEAHKNGRVVKLIGDLTRTKNKERMENIIFSVLD
ncbi:MAG: hypothetical protein LUC90_00265 [Lachnospiraceae bacterium]|nr:hypothetical protein [Lachnospiraceae bacterium]